MFGDELQGAGAPQRSQTVHGSTRTRWGDWEQRDPLGGLGATGHAGSRWQLVVGGLFFPAAVGSLTGAEVLPPSRVVRESVLSTPELF